MENNSINKSKSWFSEKTDKALARLREMKEIICK